MSNSPEKQSGPETSIEMPKVSAEQYERLSNPETAENIDIESGEKKAERARVEALETAISVEKGSAEKAKKTGRVATRRRGTISKKVKNESFKKHMAQVQSEMPAPQRVFSKFIHNPMIEKTSEVVGSTVARPNAILAGSIVAFFAVLAVYLIARTYGYVLSGFETIGAFIVGWIIGVLYDYLRVLFTGKRS